MKKIVIMTTAFCLLMAVVFVATLINDVSLKETNPTNADPNAKPKLTVGNIFEFKSKECVYDPKSDELQNQLFRGFFEEGDEDTVQFWFANRSPVPVTVHAEASCVSCSGARIASVSDDLLNDYAKTMGVGGITSPMLAGAINPMMIAAALNLDAKLPWQKFDLLNKNNALEFPGTRVGEKNGLGIVQIKIKASRSSSQTPTLTMNMAIPDEPIRQQILGMKFIYTPSAFAIRPAKHDIGELSEANPKKTFEIISWSPSRGFGETFPPQTLKADDDRIPITVAPFEKLTRAEMDELVLKISEEFKTPARVAAAYRYRVTVQRDRDGQIAEIGPFEKNIEVAGINNSLGTVQVVGSIKGFVRLESGIKIDMGTFEAQYEKTYSTTIISEKADVELEVVPEQCKPKFVKVSLSKPELNGGSKTWKLNLKIDAKQGYGIFPTSSVIVLRTVGDKPVVLRIPIAGNGVRR